MISDYFLKYAMGRMSVAELVTQFDNYVDSISKEVAWHEIISEWVKSGPSYYGWRSIKYFMFEYEMKLKGKSKSGRDKIDWSVFSKESYKQDYASVEHIYPQRARDKYWTDRFSIYSPAQKRQLRNSLGNLLPLALPRNSSLGNKSFPSKLGDEASMTGYKFGSYSENEVALLTDWNAEEIVRRGLSLLNFMEERWNLSFGDEDSKLKALGLEFMRGKQNFR